MSTWRSVVSAGNPLSKTNVKPDSDDDDWETDPDFIASFSMKNISYGDSINHCEIKLFKRTMSQNKNSDGAPKTLPAPVDTSVLLSMCI